MNNQTTTKRTQQQYDILNGAGNTPEQDEYDQALRLALTAARHLVSNLSAQEAAEDLTPEACKQLAAEFRQLASKIDQLNSQD